MSLSRSNSLKRSQQGVSLPKLAHATWAVEEEDIIGSPTRSSIVVLQLDVVQNATRTDVISDTKTIKAVLGQEQLEALLGGMRQIAQGLDAVA